MMKNKIIGLFLAAILSLPVIWAVDDNQPLEQTPPMLEEISEENLQKLDEDVVHEKENVEINNNKLFHKEPISKKTLVKKFIKAMFLVGVSVFILYFGLILFNKNRKVPQIKTTEGETPLTSPNDIADAVKIFMDKTKWN